MHQNKSQNKDLQKITNPKKHTPSDRSVSNNQKNDSKQIKNEQTMKLRNTDEPQLKPKVFTQNQKSQVVKETQNSQDSGKKKSDISQLNQNQKKLISEQTQIQKKDDSRKIRSKSISYNVNKNINKSQNNSKQKNVQNIDQNDIINQQYQAIQDKINQQFQKLNDSELNEIVLEKKNSQTDNVQNFKPNSKLDINENDTENKNSKSNTTNILNQPFHKQSFDSYNQNDENSYLQEKIQLTSQISKQSNNSNQSIQKQVQKSNQSSQSIQNSITNDLSLNKNNSNQSIKLPPKKYSYDESNVIIKSKNEIKNKIVLKNDEKLLSEIIKKKTSLIQIQYQDILENQKLQEQKDKEFILRQQEIDQMKEYTENQELEKKQQKKEIFIRNSSKDEKEMEIIMNKKLRLSFKNVVTAEMLEEEERQKKVREKELKKQQREQKLIELEQQAQKELLNQIPKDRSHRLSWALNSENQIDFLEINLENETIEDRIKNLSLIIRKQPDQLTIQTQKLDNIILEDDQDMIASHFNKTIQTHNNQKQDLIVIQQNLNFIEFENRKFQSDNQIQKQIKIESSDSQISLADSLQKVQNSQDNSLKIELIRTNQKEISPQFGQQKQSFYNKSILSDQFVKLEIEEQKINQKQNDLDISKSINDSPLQRSRNSFCSQSDLDNQIEQSSQLNNDDQQILTDNHESNLIQNQNLERYDKITINQNDNYEQNNQQHENQIAVVNQNYNDFKNTEQSKLFNQQNDVISLTNSQHQNQAQNALAYQDEKIDQTFAELSKPINKLVTSIISKTNLDYYKKNSLLFIQNKIQHVDQDHQKIKANIYDIAFDFHDQNQFQKTNHLQYVEQQDSYQENKNSLDQSGNIQLYFKMYFILNFIQYIFLQPNNIIKQNLY